MVPVEGTNPAAGSSALIRNSMECRRAAVSAVPSATSTGWPAAIISWARTRSVSVDSSVAECSTCSRVLTSRNDSSPRGDSRNSTVPALT